MVVWGGGWTQNWNVDDSDGGCRGGDYNANDSGADDGDAHDGNANDGCKGSDSELLMTKPVMKTEKKVAMTAVLWVMSAEPAISEMQMMPM